MIKNMSRAFVLGLTAFALSAAFAPASAKAADFEVVHTEAEVSGNPGKQLVTYKINLDETEVTDGRVAVLFDPEVLTFVDEKQEISFADTDFFEEYVSGDESGVSFAFVNDEQTSVSGNLLTLTFSVAEGIDEQETAIKTHVFSISNEDSDLVKSTVLEDTLTVGGKEELKAKLQTKWGALYYVLEDGTKIRGLHTIDGYTYYFKPSNGAAVKSDFATIDGYKYYFDANYHMTKGFMTKWGVTYYFADNGVEAINKVVTIDGYDYYFNEKGAMVKSNFVDLDDGRHYFDAQGHMVKGTTMVRWFVKYTFDENGVLIK
ncbi:MAG: hypothetical protein IJR29_00625 [Butyrivibrio sp.]|nr:hypothetical protein [Butyrivibrio sp.]